MGLMMARRRVDEARKAKKDAAKKVVTNGADKPAKNESGPATRVRR